MQRFKLFYGNCRLGLSVLDDMTLVQDEIVPVTIDEEVQIVANHIVRGDDQVVIRQIFPRIIKKIVKGSRKK